MITRQRVRLAVIALTVLASAPMADAQVVSATGTFERQLTVTGPVDLDVRTGSGSIDIRRGGGSEVRITGRIRAQRGFWNSLSAEDRVKAVQSNPPVAQNGNSIRIGEFTDPDAGRNVSISYEITVPHETRVQARTGSGSHHIDSIRGPIVAETGSGSIHIGEIATSVGATTGSGSIEVLGAAEGLTARTGSGSITARRARGAVRARTGSGGINIEGDPTNEWEIGTGSGGVNLRLPSSAAFDLDAHSSSGSVQTSHPIEVRGSLSKRRLQGRVRGGGPRLEISTGSGSIRLD
jgi:hypothetical protein